MNESNAIIKQAVEQFLGMHPLSAKTSPYKSFARIIQPLGLDNPH